ncbi:EAL domain-containing protein [Marinobacter sp.]|uniref:EAL domain-containing protein n=1 Tax=Marinobacter sp. TaxID=50741 RepID=UPI003F985AB3
MGFRIALDDFGTGFSSLTYLQTLPVDLVKIDKSFVINMLSKPSDRAIVESVIFLSQRFSHPILAEGVETMDHARALRQLGCEYIQGYGVARPMPASDIPEWLQAWSTQEGTCRACEL